MQNGKRAVLAVALAGLLAAGTAGVTLAQDEDQAPAAPSSHLFLIVPIAPSAGQSATPDDNAASPDDQDGSANAAPDGSAPQERSFILIPVPQAGGDEDDNATDDNDDDSGATDNVPAPDDVDSGAPQGHGGTLILVPHGTPPLPAGILEA
jgi:hypothetical protein